MIQLEIPPRRRLLLSAACHVDPERAHEAWRDLVADCGSESAVMSWIDSGSERRVLPLLHPRAGELAFGERTVAAVTDAVVESWALNERLMIAVRPTLRHLVGEGIDVMCIKGAALVGDVYPLHRLRPIGDVDIVVRPSQGRSAFRLLRELGWTPPAGSRIALAGMSAINVSLDPGASIDMHHRPARDLPHRARREPFCWANVLSLPAANPLGDLGLCRPSTAGHLLILAAHVMRATNGHLTHPLADVHRLLAAANDGTTGSLDTDELWTVCRDQLGSLRVAAVLETVRSITGVDAPDVRAIAGVTPRDAKLERRVIDSDRRATTDAVGPRATLVHAWFGVRAATTGQGLMSKGQVFIAAIVAWLDLRLGRFQWRRRTSNGRRSRRGLGVT